MQEQRKRVVVIGAGASGMIAAGVAAGRGCAVDLLERNQLVGRKVRISGKGRCNITNETDLEGLLAHIPGNPRFLRPAFHAFTPEQTRDFFAKHGVPTKVERGGRVFPLSDEAEDVVRALELFCRQSGVRLHLQTTARAILVEHGHVAGVRCADGKVFPADAVILSTGGASYPGTGSRGDGYRMAEAVGHTVVPIHPSLVPLETKESWPAEAQGLSLRNVTLTAYQPDGKKVYSELGEMLFAHFGVTGPLVLTASRHVGHLPGSRLEIDLKPALDEATLDARLLRDFEAHRRKQIVNALDDLLPRTLIPIIIRLAEIPPDTLVFSITRAQRKALIKQLKRLRLTVTQARPWTEAVVTAGGVSTQEIDPKTLESKLVPGLSFTGEVIDVDAYTGGYNLQIAWSTGYLAGQQACRRDH